MMPMPNNPMQMLMQMMQGGGNPMSFFDQMGRNNPQVQQFNQMIRGKNSNQLRSMAENIPKRREEITDLSILTFQFSALIKTECDFDTFGSAQADVI